MMKKIFSNWVLFSLLFSSTLTLAAPSIPPDDKILFQTGQATQASLPASFNLLVWNIHKADDGFRWQNDFQRLTQKSDLVLLQEGYWNDAYKQAVDMFESFLWSFAISFIYEGAPTGVVTGSPTQPLNTFWLRSPGREPLVGSPKMTIVSEFVLAQSPAPLVVANIHGINFVTNSTFYDHISQVLNVLQRHSGPLIFAGDFNTWNLDRMEFLQRACEQLGLKRIDFQNDPRNLYLDHIYYRDLKVNAAQVVSHVNSSDHYPLRANFSTPLTKNNIAH